MEQPTDKDYVWTEHIPPVSIEELTVHVEEDEDTVDAGMQHAEGFYKRLEPVFDNVSLEEAEQKQDLTEEVRLGGDFTCFSTESNNENKVAEKTPEEVKEDLVEIISEIDNDELTAEISSITEAGMECRLLQKLVKISQLTQTQGDYLSCVAKKFTKEIEGLIDYYKVEKSKAVNELNTEQQTRQTLERDFSREKSRIEVLAQKLQTSDNAKTTLKEKLHQSLKQIERLEHIIHTEQMLRKKAEQRVVDAVHKIRKAEAYRKNEEKHRKIANKQTQKAVARAREVMSYFFNLAIGDDVERKMVANNFLDGGIPDFDSLMIRGKSSLI